MQTLIRGIISVKNVDFKACVSETNYHRRIKLIIPFYKPSLKDIVDWKYSIMEIFNIISSPDVHTEYVWYFKALHFLNHNTYYNERNENGDDTIRIFVSTVPHGHLL
jgi:hypothetical protein